MQFKKWWGWVILFLVFSLVILYLALTLGPSGVATLVCFLKIFLICLVTGVILTFAILCLIFGD